MCSSDLYPGGTYAYFATVDANWNSAYPYVVGPTFYGTKTATKVTSITEPVTIYTPSSSAVENHDELLELATVFPNPSSDFIAIQLNGLVTDEVKVDLFDVQGKLVGSSRIAPGSTIAWLDIRTLYAGNYILRMTSLNHTATRRLELLK